MIFARAKNKRLCHNVAMKKSFLLLIPLLLVLGACQDVTFAYDPNDSHSAGLEGGTPSSGHYAYEYSYYPGDVLAESIDGRAFNVANLTFNNINESKTDIKDVEEIASYISVDQEIFTSVENPNFFSTKNEGFAFLGAESTYVQGQLTFNFNVPIYQVQITARTYSYIKTSFNDEALEIDNDVAISVNDSGFIKLSESANEEKSSAIQSICAYKLQEASQKITLKVGKRRAIIDKIALYY